MTFILEYYELKYIYRRVASELSRTGTIRRRNSLRRSISNIALGGGWPTVKRTGSLKKSNLGDISES